MRFDVLTVVFCVIMSCGLVGRKLTFCLPLQNPTLGILIAEWGKIVGWQIGLWSTEAKV
jgi:hypothetical protein